MSTTTAPAPIGNAHDVADRLAGRLFFLVITAFLAAMVGAGVIDAAGIPQGFTPERAALGLAGAIGGALLVARAWAVTR